MGFKSEYSRRLSRSGDTYKYGEGKCLLEFFGFKYEKWTSSYTQRVWSKDDRYIGGGYYLAGNENDHYEGYRRATRPSGRAAELENRFIELRGSSFDPLKSYYEKKSVKEYYEGLSFPGELGAALGCSFGAILGVIWVVLYKYTYPFLHSITGTVLYEHTNVTNLIWLVCGPLVIWLVCLLVGGLTQLLRRIKYGKKRKYSELTTEEKMQYRQEYLDKLESSYSGESGQILKEYAILKGYDKI